MDKETDIVEMLQTAKDAGVSISSIAENAGVHEVTLRRWMNQETAPHPSTLRLVRASLKDMLSR